ncbi:M23 family metallopeptidase [Xiashengella succiniciproducens]|uniref:M23 family metallopeptidase n=1 Tax=Xiashengella succiniciproducens TaxID=2949635 RepID=A0A9J6ZP66_9BACT|nr:M23 family metallopeptidase [Alkaliflexus sp. Ai-910]URW79465.1 M23 family metallopeptidase [Alkaliflexus sp. Ai-910]
MSKVKYKYNPETLSYDRVETGFKYYLGKAFSFTVSSAFMGLVFFFLYSNIFESPREIKLERENVKLLSQYEIMASKLDQALDVLDDIQQRDENVYRVIFEADSIPNAIRRAGFGGVNRYRYLEDLDNAELVISTAKKLDGVMKQLYVQSRSFDEIIDLAQRKEEMIRCIPAIQPISNKDLKRTASGWGMRLDPIYKTNKFHEGLDFSAPIGTEIYVTGDGVVKTVHKSAIGYGNYVEVDHGFGYTTLYAHMSEFKVRVGQKVKRGEVIGFVGNTGKSTGPHLHYEVRIKGKAVNPTHYFFQDLTPEEYEEMIRISSNSNRTFD